MTGIQGEVPRGWQVSEDEITAGVYRVVATHESGKRLELIAYEGEDFLDRMKKVIKEHERTENGR